MINKLIRFPADLHARIEKYEKDNYINSFTQAVIQLIIKGLEK